MQTDIYSYIPLSKQPHCHFEYSERDPVDYRTSVNERGSAPNCNLEDDRSAPNQRRRETAEEALGTCLGPKLPCTVDGTAVLFGPIRLRGKAVRLQTTLDHVEGVHAVREGISEE